ncbi:MAG: 6-phosphogluconolactonase [Vicinamibacterales bacterium]|nr:6-phosphogluconolactonase [Vicinamibacterales bacterium]
MNEIPEVVVAAGPDELAQLAADRVALAAHASVEARGAFHLALAGGSTPRRLYERLAGDPAYAAQPWARTHIYFGDERCVPPDHPDSNFRMAYESLLTRVPVPAAQVHRMEGEDPDPAAAAARYEARVRRALPHGVGEAPRLDLVLLGLGADGHTASLFPGTTALEASSHLVAATWVEAVAAFRLTMTLPLLNAARAVVFLVAGEDKAEAVRRVLTPPPGAPPLPAARVRPTDGTLTWLLAGVSWPGVPGVRS